MLNERAADIDRAGLSLLAVSVDSALPDHGGSESDARSLMQGLSSISAWGFLDAPSLELLHRWQAALFDKTPPFTVPLTLLLDGDGHATSLYRGPASIEAFLEDAAAARDASVAAMRNLAPPVTGAWVTKPAEPVFIPMLLARRFQADYPEASLPFLALAAKRSGGDQKRALTAELSRKHHALARSAITRSDTGSAESHFRAALAAAPDSARIHNDYGTLLAQSGRLREAEPHFDRAVTLEPDYALARRNLDNVRRLLQERRQ